MMNDDPIMKVDDILWETPIDGEVPPVAKRRPWGPWATIGWTLLTLLVMLVVQVVVFIGFMVVQGATTPKKMEELSTSSLLLSVATMMSTPAIIGVVILLIYARGCSIREYLAWRLPGWKQAILSIAGLAILLITTDVLTHLLGRPIVPEVMVNIYRTGWVVLLAITMMVAAPLGEEILFRGFFYQGIASSRWGPWVAIVLSSIIWASIHVQYDLYGVGAIVVMGFYLGEVRRRTGSLPLTIFLHTIANAVATIEMMILVHLRGG